MKTKEKTPKKASPYVRFMTRLAKIIYPKPEIVWEESLKEDEVAIFACNHSGAIGPAYTSLYLDIPKRPWVISYILNKKQAPNFVFHDFLFAEGRKCKPFFRVLSFLIAKFLPPVLIQQDPIAVHHSNRMVETFIDSVNTLTKQNKNLVIFPERPQKYSEFIFELYDGFVDLGHQYYKDTGKRLRFFPTYVCNSLHKILIGKPITYNPEEKAKAQRKVISAYIKENIDRLGRSLPKHKTVPFLPDLWFDAYKQYVGDISKYWELFE